MVAAAAQQRNLVVAVDHTEGERQGSLHAPLGTIYSSRALKQRCCLGSMLACTRHNSRNNRCFLHVQRH